jgi:hypothetical protein
MSAVPLPFILKYSWQHEHDKAKWERLMNTYKEYQYFVLKQKNEDKIKYTSKQIFNCIAKIMGYIYPNKSFEDLHGKSSYITKEDPDFNNAKLHIDEVIQNMMLMCLYRYELFKLVNTHGFNVSSGGKGNGRKRLDAYLHDKQTFRDLLHTHYNFDKNSKNVNDYTNTTFWSKLSKSTNLLQLYYFIRNYTKIINGEINSRIVKDRSDRTSHGTYKKYSSILILVLYRFQMALYDKYEKSCKSKITKPKNCDNLTKSIDMHGLATYVKKIEDYDALVYAYIHEMMRQSPQNKAVQGQNQVVVPIKMPNGFKEKKDEKMQQAQPQQQAQQPQQQAQYQQMQQQAQYQQIQQQMQQQAQYQQIQQQMQQQAQYQQIQQQMQQPVQSVKQTDITTLVENFIWSDDTKIFQIHQNVSNLQNHANLKNFYNIVNEDLYKYNYKINIEDVIQEPRLFEEHMNAIKNDFKKKTEKNKIYVGGKPTKSTNKKPTKTSRKASMKPRKTAAKGKI